MDIFSILLDSPLANTAIGFVAPAVTVYLGAISGTLLPARSGLSRLQRLIAAIPFAILISAPQATIYLLAIRQFHLDALMSVSLYAVLIGACIRQGQALGMGVLPELSRLLGGYFQAILLQNSSSVAKALSETANTARDSNFPVPVQAGEETDEARYPRSAKRTGRSR